MIEADIVFDAEKIIGQITELQRVQIPRAGMLALNKAVYEASQELKRQAEKTFTHGDKRPVPLTLNAFKYDKATIEKLEAKLYIRNDVPKGNSPSRYLLPQIYGGQHYRTRFQRALGYTVNPDDGGPILAPNRIMIPTGSAMVRRNVYGNMSPGQYTTILSKLRNESSAGNPIVHRNKARNKTAFRYFYISQEMLDDQYRNLNSRRPGIFMSMNGRLSKVMTEINLPTYTGKFAFRDIALTAIDTEFKRTFSALILR